MIKKLLPLGFLIIGTGAGIGAGLLMTPKDASKTHAKISDEAKGDHEEPAKGDAHGAERHGDAEGVEYVKLNNQFVIPVVQKDRMSSLVVMSLSLETEYGLRELIYEREPKLRDSFLQVLFDHANMGGFDGAFTRPEALDPLRAALLDVARKELGSKVSTVLIIDLARQDT